MPGLRDLRSIELGQAVHEAVEPCRVGVRRAIPARVVFAPTEAEVRAQIDDAIRQLGELLDAANCAPVRQAEEQDVDPLQRLGPHELERRPAPQIGMREVHELAVQPLARHLPHVEAWMAEEQPDQLAAGVAGRADDGGGQ